MAWDAEHEGAFAWAWGLRPLQVWRAGAPVLNPPAPGATPRPAATPGAPGFPDAAPGASVP